MMITDIENKLLIRYLRNELNDTESQQVVSWLQENEANKHLLFGLKEAYMLSRWDELRKKAETENSWNELKQSLNAKQTYSFNKWVRIGLQYAAIAILFLVSGFLLHDLIQDQPTQYNIIQTASGKQSTLILSDGTKVTLNENSKLIYPTNFNHGERNVTLLGEAFFEVIHNEKQPFLVHVHNYTVKDLGTKFDIKAYPNEIYSYTSLQKGKVQILDNTKGNKILSELQPGSQLAFNGKTGNYSVKAIDNNAIAEWIPSKIIIRHKTLAIISQILSSKYGYTIELKNRNIEKLTYNITIEKEPLDEILSDIHIITPQVGYSINQEKKIVTIK
jgi:ferric-dicitrate binding protein FerR (iron transport regulator)